MKNRNFYRIVSLVLVFSLAISLISVPAFASDVEISREEIQEVDQVGKDDSDEIILEEEHQDQENNNKNADFSLDKDATVDEILEIENVESEQFTEESLESIDDIDEDNPFPFSGEGTEQNPYRIRNAYEFLKFYDWMQYINSGNRWAYEKYTRSTVGKYFLLETDIYFNEDNWTPIDNFFGVLDGNNHTIHNVNIISSDDLKSSNAGLFSNLDNKDNVQDVHFIPEVKNLNIKNMRVENNLNTTKRLQYIGGIAGCIENAKITNCTIDGLEVTPDIKYQGDVGGMAGMSYGGEEIVGCINIGDININYYEDSKSAYSVGGIISSSKGIVRDCINYGNVCNNHVKTGVISNTSGLVAKANDATIENCVNEGDIEGVYYVGGVLGEGRFVNVINCTNKGDITTSEGSNGNAGGVAYRIGENVNSESTVQSCTNEGTVTGNSVAGIVYSLADNNKAVDCINNGEVIGNSVAAGICGSSSNGTQINNCENKAMITIKQLSSYTTPYYAAGIVGNSYGDIKNCINNGDIYSDGAVNYLAGIVASAGRGKIFRCSNNGRLAATDRIQGIAGISADNHVQISSCENRGDISYNTSYQYGDGGIGGIIGRLDSGYSMSSYDVDDCYNSGDVQVRAESESICVGGIVGKASVWNRTCEFSINNCYNVGNIITDKKVGSLIGKVDGYTDVTVINCYGLDNIGNLYGYINEDAGAVFSGCSKKTTSQMKNQSTYVDWDFDNVWEMGQDDYLYPVLRIQEEEIPEEEWFGVSNNISWEVTKDGLLTIIGTGDWERDSFGNPPWIKLRNKINRVKMSVTDISDISYAFAGLRKAENIDMSESNFSLVTKGNGLISDCQKLVNMRTPLNLDCDIELGWLYTDGNDFLDESLPKNKETSLSIHKDTDHKRITYYGNLGSGNKVLRTQYYIPGEDIICPDDMVNPEYPGFEFWGWYDEPSYEGKEFFSEDNESNRVAKSDDFSIWGDFYEIKEANSNNRYWADNKGKHVEIELDERLFGKDTTKYDHNLGRFAIEMSTLCYSQTSSNKRSEEVYVALRELGFNRIEHHTYEECGNGSTHTDIKYEKGKKEEGAYSPYWIASKKIKIGGEETTIIGVFIRGTYCEEWIDNFDPLKGFTHAGFDRAANKVVEGISEYYDKYVTGESRILVTGHSRGAATANLAGKKLDDGIVDGISMSNAYIYTFATPNTARISKTEKIKYANIYNIVNPEDFVTKVLPTAWGYGRYGNTYVLPSKTTDVGVSGDNYVNYNQYLEDVNDYLFALGYGGNDTEDYYIPYDRGMGAVSDYVNLVSFYVQNIKEYYEMSLRTQIYLGDNSGVSLHDLYTLTLGYFESGVDKYKKLSYAFISEAATGCFGIVGIATIDFFFRHQMINSSFENAHVPEYYLAAMHNITKEQLMAPRKTLKGITNCPVDIYIYDGDGVLVGQIVNNKIQNDNTVITMNVEGDSKTFYLPSTEDYRIELIGNDNGTMDYSLLEMDADTGEVGRVFFNDIGVNVDGDIGSRYTQNIAADGDIGELSLVDDFAQIILPDMVLNFEQIGQLSVTTTTEGAEGYADNMANLTPGDYVELNAYETDTSVFDGWYNESGELISKENPYGFSISEDVSLVAKFIDVPDGLYIVTTDEGSYEYKGTAIKPEFKVYDGKTELTLNKDYTVKYTNNTNAYTLSEGDEGFDKKKAPTITVTGKGNYTGSEVAYFTINRKSIEDEDLLIGGIATTLSNGKIQRPVPSVKWGKKALSNNKDFKVSYFTGYDEDSKEYTGILSSKEGPLNAVDVRNGDSPYYVVVDGIGNYEGRIVKTFVIENKNEKKLFSKLSFSKIKDKPYKKNENGPIDSEVTIKTSQEIAGANVDLLVKDGKKELIGLYKEEYESLSDDDKKNYDFVLEYVTENRKDIGTVTVRLTGTEHTYVGSKDITYKITGTSISDTKKVKIENFVSSKPYSKGGLVEQEFELYTQTVSGKNTVKNYLVGIEAEEYEYITDEEKYMYDYTFKYDKNQFPGKASLVCKGVNGYTGTLTKTYTITGRDIKKAVISGLVSSYVYDGTEKEQPNAVLKYTEKKGEQPDTLNKISIDAPKESGDYTVSYKNNVKAGTATVTFTGTGRYTGSISKTYKITANNMATNVGAYSIAYETEVPYAKGGAKPNIIHVKFGDEELAIGKDYIISYGNNRQLYQYAKDDTGFVAKKAPTITIAGKGNYSGKIIGYFKIRKQNISADGINVSLPDKVYSKKVGAWKSTPTITDKDGKKLAAGTDYQKNIEYFYESIPESAVILDGASKTFPEIARSEGDRVGDKDIVPAGVVIRTKIIGNGPYTGSRDGESSTVNDYDVYRVVGKDVSKVSATIAAKKYTGKAVTLSAEDITLNAGTKKNPILLTEGEDYVILNSTYKNNIKKGKGTVVVKGINNYGGTKTLTFTIGAKGFMWWWRNLIQ